MPRRKKPTESPVERRAAVADATDEVIRQDRGRIEEKVTQMLEPMLQEDETVPRVGLVLELLRRWLVVYRGRMVDADDAHRATLARISRLFGLRNRVARALSRRLVDFRAFLKSVFGRETPEIFGFVAGEETPRPKDPEALLAAAEAVGEALRDPGTEMPPPRHAGVDADPKAVLPHLQAETSELRGHVRELEHEQQEEPLTRHARDEAMAEFDVVFSHAVGCLRTISLLAGEDDPADRIRRSADRSARRHKARRNYP